MSSSNSGSSNNENYRGWKDKIKDEAPRLLIIIIVTLGSTYISQNWTLKKEREHSLLILREEREHSLLILREEREHSYTLLQEEKTQSFIQQTYFIEGIYKIESKLSAYGTSTTFAFIDIIRVINTYNKDPNFKDILEGTFEEIRGRKLISELINRDYDYAFEGFPRLRIFGDSFYGAIKNTFYIYSRWIDTITDIDHMMIELTEIEKVVGEGVGIQAVAEILQFSQMYLESRIRKLEIYLSANTIANYTDFLKILNDQSFHNFNIELDEYLYLLNNWTSSMNESEETRMLASNDLGQWLLDSYEKNPFNIIT